MFYPLYIHKYDGSAWGGAFPDFPGCFTAADELEDLPRNAQEAVEVHFDGEDVEIPPPSDPAVLGRDDQYRGGTWLLVDIDLARVNPKAVRLNVSLPANLLYRIDRHVAQQHQTRSGFLAFAAAAALARVGSESKGSISIDTEGGHAVLRPGSTPTSAVAPTQAKAIRRAKGIPAGAELDVAPVRQSGRGSPDGRRKA